MDDDINLNQIQRKEEDDERYAPKEELPTVVGTTRKEAAKMKTGSWQTIERARQSDESDDDYDLSALRRNKTSARNDSEESDLDVRRKRKNDSDSDLEVQRRRKRDDSDTEVRRRPKQRNRDDSDTELQRRPNRDDSDTEVQRRRKRDNSEVRRRRRDDSGSEVKRKRRDHESPEASNGSRFNHQEDRRRDHPKNSQSSKHWSSELAKDGRPSKYDQHESRRPDDDRQKDYRQRDDRQRDDRQRDDRQREARRYDDKPQGSKDERESWQHTLKKESESKDHRGFRKEHKKSKKSSQSKSRSKSIDVDAKKKRKSKERKSRSSSKPSKSRSKSVEIKKERRSISTFHGDEPARKSSAPKVKQEEDRRSRSKHKKRRSEDSEKNGKSRKSKHHKSSKERSPKVKKINEISDSDEEDIRTKIANLYKTEPSGVSAEDEELKAKHKRWTKGLKQIEEKQKRLAEEEHEMSKPLARYKDDADLDAHLREQELVDDPMLEYFRQRKKEKDHQQQLEETGEIWAIPKYESKVPPPVNRFNIWPGYRWDGVDRSNQWEQKILAKKAEKNAAQEEAYKYSSVDM